MIAHVDFVQEDLALISVQMEGAAEDEVYFYRVLLDEAIDVRASAPSTLTCAPERWAAGVVRTQAVLAIEKAIGPEPSFETSMELRLDRAIGKAMRKAGFEGWIGGKP